MMELDREWLLKRSETLRICWFFRSRILVCKDTEGQVAARYQAIAGATQPQIARMDLPRPPLAPPRFLIGRSAPSSASDWPRCRRVTRRGCYLGCGQRLSQCFIHGLILSDVTMRTQAASVHPMVSVAVEWSLVSYRSWTHGHQLWQWHQHLSIFYSLQSAPMWYQKYNTIWFQLGNLKVSESKYLLPSTGIFLYSNIKYFVVEWCIRILRVELRHWLPGALVARSPLDETKSKQKIILQ